MSAKLFLAAIVSAAALLLFTSARAATQPQEFSTCLKRTQSDRNNCQSGCGMILQQCYDEAVDAANGRTDTLLAKLAKEHSPACAALSRKYADGASQLGDSVVQDASAQLGWLGAELKMRLAEQRYEAVKLIDAMCK